MTTHSAPKVRYSYPVHAILLVAAAWVFFMVSIAAYTTVAIALFPLSPFIFAGGVCFLSMAHGYAISVRKQMSS
jgi:hypothetical protein